MDKHKLAGGMSDKKIHEVELLAQLIKTIGDKNGITQVLDLGSGQGYLSRILAFKHGMRVLAVDMSEIQTKGAERFDQRALKALSLSSPGTEEQQSNASATMQGTLKHVTEMVTPDNVGDVLSKWGDGCKDKDDKEDQRWIVCGLHTCGDLATSIFRLFATSEQIQWAVNVGCCYHFLSEQGEQPGFPMGEALKAKGYQLGNSARVLACQSPSKWTDPVIGQQSFNQYFYRAVLLVKSGDTYIEGMVTNLSLWYLAYDCRQRTRGKSTTDRHGEAKKDIPSVLPNGNETTQLWSGRSLGNGSWKLSSAV